MDAPHVVFTGGGTGGHLVPGLAVAEQLREINPRTRITFAVSGTRLERDFVEQYRFDILQIPSAPLPDVPQRVLRFVAENWMGYRESTQFLKQNPASLVVGLGGYASFPMSRAAVSQNIPLMLLEQNAFPGKATRWLAPNAEMVCVSFAQAQQHLPVGCPVYLTGNPIRSDISALHPSHRKVQNTEQGVGPSRLRIANPESPNFFPKPTIEKKCKGLLVLGGSQGSEALNCTVPFALHHLRKHLKGWYVLHQSGHNQVESTRMLYRKFGINATVMPTIKDMATILRHGDLAVSRAGGTTLAELACAGVPSVMVPYPYAKDRHQELNAEAFTSTGAGKMIIQPDDSERFDHRLADALEDCLVNDELRQDMRSKLTRIAQPHAARLVASLIQKECAQRFSTHHQAKTSRFAWKSAA